MAHRGNVQRVVGSAAVVVLLAALLAFHVAGRAGAGEARCKAHRADARERSALVTGTGERIVVIGDSWSVGLGLADRGQSWPSRLPGETHVAGFSGSGFSERASHCPGMSFADRAADAVRADPDVVVVAGGLNDYDQPDVAIERGFHRLMRALAGQEVVVAGPAVAPSRAGRVPRVDGLLAELSGAYGVPYIATSDVDLRYLGDGLHLTEDGHTVFGDVVAERLDAVIPARPHLG